MQAPKNQQVQKKFGLSSPGIKAESGLFQEKHFSQSSNNQEIRFFRFLSRGEKDKKIKRKPDSILQKLKIYAPISFQHVSNFLNIISINQRAVKDKTFEESYFRSIFYIKSIEKVQVRKNALILYLKNQKNYQSQSEKHKIQYLIQRYKSFGDFQFYQLALQLQNCYKKYRATNFNSKLSKCYESQPLSRFIESMQDKIYGCKVAPNKLIISRALLQLLGQDMQSFALGLCKYKAPMQEIISSEQYCSVINKSIQSIGLLCDFLQQTIDLQTLQQHSYFQFYDYLCTKKQKKIYCKIKLYMPTPLMNCLQAIQVKNQFQESSIFKEGDQMKRKLFIDEVQQIRFRQSESLKQLIKVQENMLIENKDKVPNYVDLNRK